jgi:hypothetical protein
MGRLGLGVDDRAEHVDRAQQPIGSIFHRLSLFCEAQAAMSTPVVEDSLRTVEGTPSRKQRF